MPLSLTTEVRMIKGVGPQRAELLAKRGIYTAERSSSLFAVPL